MFVAFANVRTTGNACKNLDAIMMSKGKRLMQMRPGPAQLALALATKTKSRGPMILRKNSSKSLEYPPGSQKDSKLAGHY